jgi:hypothetical protein
VLIRSSARWCKGGPAMIEAQVRDLDARFMS